MDLFGWMEQMYSGDVRKLMVLPIVLFFVLVFLAFVWPGNELGVDLKGGVAIIIQSSQPIPGDELSSYLSQEFGLQDLSITTTSSGATIQFSNIPEGQEDFSSRVQAGLISRFNLPADAAFQLSEVPPAVGAIFWQTAMTVTIAAIILLILIIFILYRDLVPALTIIFSSAFDIVFALAAMPFFNIPISLPTLSALLMIMGYSIDTEILLINRVLKGVGKTPQQQAVSSFKTGVLMTLTAIAAVTVMVVFSFLNQMVSIYQIAIVLLFGLVADLIVTWMLNAPVCLLYHSYRKKQRG